MNQCEQCGTCCRKGGPALHQEDLGLLRQGVIGFQHLTTIRKGELALSPKSGRLEVTATELIKLNGSNGSWSCCFLDKEQNACTIYDRRPLECRLLKCWDTEELESSIGKSTLSRSDLVGTDNPLCELITLHDHQCACPDLKKIIAGRQKNGAALLGELSVLVDRDLSFRSRVLTEFNLPPSFEMFAFGRPLFIVLNSMGIDTHEERGAITLSWRD